ncbi:MAG: terminase gpA endonuclease subunit [Candidatus Cryosericum sp.]
MDLAHDWYPAERSALTLPAGLTVSQWAADHREFPPGSSSPGRWDVVKGRLAEGPMDAFNEPRVERITLIAAARSLKTNIMLNMLGYAISQDPAPALWVSSTDSAVKRACRRVRGMIRISPELRRFRTGNPDDEQTKSIVLKHMEGIFATAGSAADLGDFEARFVLEDETDKYPQDVGEQGSPPQMAEMRAQSYWNRKIVTACTPTVPEGFITKDYDRSDRRRFWVPCLFCGGYQVLDFSRVTHAGEKVGQWPKEKRQPDYIKLNRVARYRCFFCEKEIEESARAGMLDQGLWIPGGSPLGGGAITADFMWNDPPVTREGSHAPVEFAIHQGFWWNGLYSPAITWSEMAAKFFEVYQDRQQLKTWVNLWDGKPWKEIISVREPCSLVAGEDSLVTGRPELEVPDNVVALTLGADNHKRGLAVSVWAWERLAPRVYNQHLIRYGWLDFEDLGRWMFDDVYHNRDGSLVYRVWRGALDTGGGHEQGGDTSLTEQAYEWLRSRGQGRVFGVKGSSGRHNSGNRMKGSRVDRMPGGKALPGGLQLWMLDTHAFKDAFWSRVESGRVFFHKGTGEEFARQLTAEAREWDQKKKQWLWQQQGSQPNHYLDTTVYAAAMADPECWGGLEVVPLPVAAKKEMRSREEVNPFTGKPQGSFLE